MAHFTHDQYQNKINYAYRISQEGLEKIAEVLCSRDETLDFDEVIFEIKCIQKLSHERHVMHSSRENDYDCFHVLGNQYTEDDLIDEVNTVCRRYGITNKILRKPEEPDMSGEDSLEDIAEYYGIDYIEDDAENHWEIIDTLNNDWAEAKDAASDMIRRWFKSINQEYGTTFPDKD